MESKTKLGLSTTIMAAIVCFFGLFGGYTPLLLVVGYVLIREEDAWLRQTAVGVLFICLAFSLLNTLLGLIPDLIAVLNNLAAIFKGSFSIPFVSRVITFFKSTLSFLEQLILLVLAFLSLMGKQIKIPALEKFTAKYLSGHSKD